MKIKIFSIIASIILILTSCGDKKVPQKIDNQPLSCEKNVLGDSTLYGLVCDGCTDSILVILPYSGGNPKTYSILDAMISRQVYGMPKVGDQMAVILSKDRKSANKVYDLDEMMGKWCYKAVPTLNLRPGMNKKESIMIAEHMPDSIRKKMMIPKEYGIELKRDKTASSVGRRHRQSINDGFSPVTYPTQKHYTAWHFYNGKIILTTGDVKIPGIKKIKNEIKKYYRKNT
jgi:hypothetical protein